MPLDDSYDKLGDNNNGGKEVRPKNQPQKEDRLTKNKPPLKDKEQGVNYPALIIISVVMCSLLYYLLYLKYSGKLS